MLRGWKLSNPIQIIVDEYANFQKAAWLFDVHWKETESDQDKIKLDMDFDAYCELAENGLLHLVSVNHNGKIVGYHASVVRPHLHHKSSLMAFTLSYYLHPDYRTSGIGRNMFKKVEETLKERGVQKLYVNTKKAMRFDPLFLNMGYREDETVYAKVIGD